MKIVDVLGARVFHDEERIITQVIGRLYLTCVLVAGGEPKLTQHWALLFTGRGSTPTVSISWSRAK